MSLANDCGVNQGTIKSWLSVLEASYIIYFVPPQYNNFRKRLIKAPRMYFTDVGLAAYFINISEEGHIESHPQKGALFETFVVSEILKERINKGMMPNLYYFRDNTGHEVDILLERGSEILPVEIKMGKTMNKSFLKGLNYYKKLNKAVKKTCLVYGGKDSFSSGDVDVVSYKDLSGKW